MNRLFRPLPVRFDVASATVSAEIVNPHPPQLKRPPRTRLASLVCAIGAISAVALVGVGCTERRVGLSKDALVRAYQRPESEPLPTAAELLKLRWPEPPPMPAAVHGSAAAEAFARGVDVDGDDALACLAADVDRRYDAIVDRCLAFAVAHPADPRAPAVVRVVARNLGSVRDEQRARVVSELRSVVARCADDHVVSCADLAVIVDDARRQATVDDATAAAVARDSVWWPRGVAEGPFVFGDEAFSISPFARDPLDKDPRYHIKDVVEDLAGDGALAPADGDAEGWWKIGVRGTSPETDALLVVKTGSVAEIRVDDVAVAVRPRGAAVESYVRVPLHLNAGVHAVDVLSYDSGSGVRIALLTPGGQQALAPLPKNKWGRAAGARVRADDGAYASFVVPPRIDNGDVDVLAALAFKDVFARAGYGVTVDDEREIARALLRHFGWALPALVFATQTVEDDVLPERVSGALAAPLWARVTALRPNHPLPLLSRARIAAEVDPEGALAARRAVVAARPDYPVGFRELIDALLERDVVDEAVAAADALLALGETQENVDAAVPALRAAGQMTRALRLVEHTARRDDAVHRARLARGDVDDARAAARRRHEAGDLRGTTRLLDLLEVSDPATALVVADEALARRPLDRQLQERRARLAVLSSTSTPAPLPPAPTAHADLDAWQWRESAGGETPWTARYALGDAVMRARAAMAEPHPGFGSVFLLEDNERVFADDGSSLVIRHWIAELRSKDALDGFGELNVDDDERLLRLRVVKRDGTVVLPERHSNVDDVSLPGLTPGDLVEWLSVRAEPVIPSTYWETRALQTSIPAVERRSIVRVPRALKDTMALRFVTANGAPAPRVSENDGVVTAVFSMPGVPILDEPQSVERDEVEPLAGFLIAFDDTDEARARFWRRQRVGDLPNRTRRDAWLEQAAAQIAGRGPSSERYERLFRFVAEHIVAADSPVDAVNVLAAGTGQRLPLFVALARAAGLPVHVLAVQSPLTAPGPLPHKSSYGAVVVVVDVDPAASQTSSQTRSSTSAHYVWLADTTALSDALPAALRGGATLDVETGVVGVIPDAVVDDGRVVVDVDLAYADGALRGYVALRLPPAVAEAVRPGLRQATPEQLAQLLEASLTASLPGVTATSPTIPGLATGGAPLAIVTDVVVPATPGADGTVRFEHLFAQGAAAAFSAGTPLATLSRVAERHRPLRVFPEADELRLQLRLPEQASFVEVPESVSLTAGPVSLRQTASVDDGVLYFERTLRRAGARVPVAEWVGVRAALAPLVARADARVAFVAAETHGAAE